MTQGSGKKITEEDFKLYLQDLTIEKSAKDELSKHERTGEMQQAECRVPSTFQS